MDSHSRSDAVDIKVSSCGREPRAVLRYAVLEPYACEAEIVASIRPPYVVLRSGARVPSSDAMDCSLRVILSLSPSEHGFQLRCRWARQPEDGSVPADLSPMHYSSNGLRLSVSSGTVNQAPEDAWYGLARMIVESHLTAGILPWPREAVGPGARWRARIRETEGTACRHVELLVLEHERCLVRVTCWASANGDRASTARPLTRTAAIDAIYEIALAQPTPFGLSRGASVHSELLPPNGYHLLSEKYRASLPDKGLGPVAAAELPALMQTRLRRGQVRVTASSPELQRQRKAWVVAQTRLRKSAIESPHEFDFDRLADLRR